LRCFCSGELGGGLSITVWKLMEDRLQQQHSHTIKVEVDVRQWLRRV
jgi:hypothetical protein